MGKYFSLINKLIIFSILKMEKQRPKKSSYLPKVTPQMGYRSLRETQCSEPGGNGMGWAETRAWSRAAWAGPGFEVSSVKKGEILYYY